MAVKKHEPRRQGIKAALWEMENANQTKYLKSINEQTGPAILNYVSNLAERLRAAI